MVKHGIILFLFILLFIQFLSITTIIIIIIRIIIIIIIIIYLNCFYIVAVVVHANEARRIKANSYLHAARTKS